MQARTFPDPNGARGPLPLIVFALDSFDLNLLDRWCAEGVLPNLARLKESGTCLVLEGGGVFDEVGSWATLYCGQSPLTHGYYSGRRLRPGSYEIELITPQDLDYQPFWQPLVASGRAAAILEPPEGRMLDGLSGVQLLNLCQHQEEYCRRPCSVEPAELMGDIARLMPKHEVLRFDRFERRTTYYRRQFRKNLDMLASRNRLFRNWLRRQSYEFVIIGFGEAHDAAHMLWPWHQRALRGETIAWGGGDPVRVLYRAIDDEIGKYLTLFGPRCNVVIASAYGMKSEFPGSVLGESLLQMLGYQVMNRQLTDWSSPLSVARRFLPEPLRRRLSSWLPLDTQIKLANDSFTNGIDFRRSRAFNLPGVYSNWIRVNLAGREPLGIVQAGPEYEQLLDEIEHEFWQLRDPHSGEKAVSAVLRTAAGKGADPLSSSLPDLYVHWRACDHLVERLIHPAGEVMQPKPNFYRDSYHRLPGFAIVTGPGIEKGRQGHCDYLDFAPSCMSLMGLPIEPAMQGGSVFLPG